MSSNRTLLMVLIDAMDGDQQERLISQLLHTHRFERAQELIDQAEEMEKLKEGLIIKAETTDVTSWMLYPDRMGGQFTEEELRDAERWR